MVWPFKKQKEVIDLTYLAKRGLIKLPAQKPEYQEINPMNPAPSDSGGFDLLSSLASAAPSLSGLSEEKEAKMEPGMKNKVEDVEFRLNTLIRKVDNMLDRLDLVEKKVSRNERQGN